MWMPQGTDADGIVRLELAVQLLRLPVPDKQLPVRIARNQVAATTCKHQNLIEYSLHSRTMPVSAIGVLSHTTI